MSYVFIVITPSSTMDPGAMEKMRTFCIQSHKDQFLKVHIFSIARRTFHFPIRGMDTGENAHRFGFMN